MDSDHDAIEVMHRRLREKATPISAMVVDLGNPSPAIGFRNREREAWLERANAECVLALALVHHLMVSGNLSPAAVRDMLSDLTSDLAVVEFVPTDDAMFKELLKHRVGPFDEVSLEVFVETMSERFELLEREPIPGTGRILLFLRRRNREGGERRP